MFRRASLMFFFLYIVIWKNNITLEEEKKKKKSIKSTWNGRRAKRGERSSFYVSPGKRDIWKWLYCSLFLFGRREWKAFFNSCFPSNRFLNFWIIFHFSFLFFDQIWETARITKGLAPSLCHRAKQSEKWERRLLAITWSRLNCGYTAPW